MRTALRWDAKRREQVRPPGASTSGQACRGGTRPALSFAGGVTELTSHLLGRLAQLVRALA